MQTASNENPEHGGRDANVFAAGHWRPLVLDGSEVPGVRVRDMRPGRTSAGDSYEVLRLESGASMEIEPVRPHSLLVIDGGADVTAAGTTVAAGVGAYRVLGDEPAALSAGPAGAMAVLLGGPMLGDSVENVLGPEGWVDGGNGLRARILAMVTDDGPLRERAIGWARVEPGGSVSAHHHETAHLFLFLDGEADDVLVHPDNRVEQIVRRRGDFVEYPYPLEHRLTSSAGCTIFFVHEAVGTDDAPQR